MEKAGGIGDCLECGGAECGHWEDENSCHPNLACMG